MSGLLWSYGFVFAVIGLSTLLDKLNVFDDEGSRKFIHIGVANWWLIAMWQFEGQWTLAIIPPATFIVLNYLSYRFNLVKSMERDQQSTRDLGTVYYAISLFIVTGFAFYFDLLLLGLVAILAMGYGDGLGAVIGKRFGKRKITNGKTIAGSLTMLLATLIIGVIAFPEQWYLMIFVAFIAMFIELLTPRGLDNLTVPLGIFLLLVVIL